MDTSQWPQGNVAFLFTDIEGSSAIWERSPAAMQEAYQRHDAILREAASANGGVVYKIVGDAFQIAFPSAAAAIAAAVRAQIAMLDEAWPLPHPLRVRMALHLAPASPDRAGDYRTPQLNRLGRLIALAHGGQILCTHSIGDAAAAGLPDGIAIRPLGTIWLRGIDLPEAIGQIAGDRLLDHFPPLVTPDLAPNNLPASPAPLIGRAPELHAIAELLGERKSRLVTLTGSGGVGKTRLAIEAARELHATGTGIFFVDLSGVWEPKLVLPAIAGVLGVRSSGSASSSDALISLLKNESWLLLLDNLEQVIDSAPSIAGLAGSCPQLRLMVTSREPMRVQGERILRIEPLAVPAPETSDDLPALLKTESVELFMERARAVRSGFSLDHRNAADIAAICVALDGLPLAIELAASRIRAFSPASLRHSLTHGMSTLATGERDRPVRHQSLRDAIAWSFALLAEADRRALQGLSLFAGGFTLDAAATVFERCSIPGQAADLVLSLFDKSFLQHNGGASSPERFRMYESVRAFAFECLDAHEDAASARAAFAAWCLAWGDAASTQTPEISLQRIDDERDNLLAALRWAVAEQRTSLSLRLSTIMARYWRVRGHVAEGRRFLEPALLAAGSERSRERLGGMVEAASLAFTNGDFDDALRWGTEGLALARDLGVDSAEAACLNTIAGVRLTLGDIDEAEKRYLECAEIARRIGDRRRLAGTLGNLGAVAHYRDDYADATRLYREALAMQRTLDDELGVAVTLGNILSLLAPFPEHHDEALQFGAESLRLSRQHGDRQGEAYALTVTGYIANSRGEAAQAIECHRRALAIFEEIDDRSGIARALDNLGQAHLTAGDMETALQLCLNSLDRFFELQERDAIAHGFEGLATIACATRAYELAVALLATAETIRNDLGVPVPIESRSRYDRTISTLQIALGQRTLAACWARGRTHSIAEGRMIAHAFSIEERSVPD